MPEDSINLETLYYILNQYSEDVMKDCPKLIENLLKSLILSVSNESFQFLNNKALAGIKALLSLYENTQRSNNRTKSELPVNVIIQGVKLTLHCSSEQCKFADHDVQCNIISVVSLLFKNILLQNSQEYLEQLNEFYNYILTGIKNSQRECKKDCLIFKLKILNAVHQAFVQISNDEFHEKFKLLNRFDECELFANLVFHYDNDVVNHTLIYLIPEYINYSKNYQVVEFTWKQISDLKSDSCDKYFKTLSVLSNFLNICFDKSSLKPDIDFFTIILEDAKYWELVQCALVENDPVKRKLGMYLLKKTIDILNNNNKNITCYKEEIIFSWDLNCKDELYKIYCEIITVLEFLEEQQFHIVVPIFKMIKTLGEKITECSFLNFSWILLLFKKAIMHENIQIVKLGLSEFFDLPTKFFSCEHIIRQTVELLVTTLNNTSLYYNNGFAISELLGNFIFIKIESLDEGLDLNHLKLFLSLFINKICLQVWSAEALFFVTNALSIINIRKIRKQIFGIEELHAIGTFAVKAFKTHNKIIRTAVQFQLLAAVASLTDTTNVPFETLILMLSKFPLKEMFLAKGEVWSEFFFWFRKFTRQEVEIVLQRYKKGVLGEEFNEKVISLLLILSEFEKAIPNPTHLRWNYLEEISSSFKEIDKRLYCDKSLYDHYLSVVCHVFDTYMINDRRDLINFILPFVNDILLYIQIQLRQISTLQEFSDCLSYLNAFQIISKTLILFKTDTAAGKIAVEVKKILKEVEVNSLLDSDFPCVGIYWRVKLLVIALETHPFLPDASFLNSYLLKKVNEPLKKDYDQSEKSRDLQTLWGRMNSEFLEGKWKILEYSIKNELIGHGPSDILEIPWIKSDDLAGLCAEVLNTGGYGVLCPVMSVLKNLLPTLESFPKIKSLVESVWKLIMERRKTEEFKQFIKYFVEMLYQETLLLKGDFAQEILFQFADFIFSETSLVVVNIFMEHIQQIDLLNCSPSLFCHVVGKGLIFGPVQKKDERLIGQVYHYIWRHKIYDTWKIGDFNKRSEIRARAVCLILMLNKKSLTHQAIARNLIETLFKMESEINKNRTRYFGDSHVHRVKHRLMQALLILEPMLNENENKTKEVWDWLLYCLLTENSQPSVRYMQEWLLVRMILRHSLLRDQFSLLYSHNKNPTKMNKKGLCSLIGVAFHLCLQMPEIIEREFKKILYFCFHQHFEVRLYALVAFWKLYQFAESNSLTSVKSTKVTDSFKMVYQSLKTWILHHKDLTGNQFRNFEKLTRCFYFVAFNPLKNYSLEIIYETLPKLAKVGSDEWVSAEMFEYCGGSTHFMNVNIPLKTTNCSLRNYENIKLDDFVGAFTTSDDEKSEGILNNYQKKIIPTKLLIPDWDDECISDENRIMRQDGLVVVASLIDRMPNLGGLARTCEIFGASEYVVNSLKCIEDKQFISLSVTAEKWISVKEVKIQNLIDYIFTMKQNGYTVVGAEQALCSINLNAVKFPKKSLLLLGNEKEGIPPNLLPLLDICVEIPQLGVIRSLNVHVTGALFIWEYAKQNNM